MQKLEAALQISRDTGCSPSPCPAWGSDEPQPNKSPFSPARPAWRRRLSGRTRDAGQEPTGRRGVQPGRGEPGGLGRADSAAGAGWDEAGEPEGRPAVLGKAAVRWAPRAAGDCGAGRKLLQRVLGSTPGSSHSACPLPPRSQYWEKAL